MYHLACPEQIVMWCSCYCVNVSVVVTNAGFRVLEEDFVDALPNFTRQFQKHAGTLSARGRHGHCGQMQIEAVSRRRVSVLGA